MQHRASVAARTRCGIMQPAEQRALHYRYVVGMKGKQ
jgi:hypothetical protein